MSEPIPPPRGALLLEGDSAARAVAVDVLRRLGCEVHEAVDEDAALAVLGRERIRLAVLGPRPAGVEGLQLLDHVRRLRPELPILVLGEGGTMHSGIEALRRGAQAYLLKPLRPDELAFAADKLLQGQPPDLARAELEARLRHSQQLALVARLAGGVAHDLNNMLTVVVGLSDYQRLRLAPEHPLRESAEDIHRAALQAGSLARRLLGLSRPPDPDPCPVNLNMLLLDMEKMLGYLLRADITLETVLDPALAAVEASPGGLEQVLLNLVLNARDAMPHGGRVTVTTANLVVDRPAAGVDLPPGAYVTLAVRDTGSGMDAATQARAFEPFFTTKGVGQGTGLGLAIVADVVQQSGGFVRVASAPGRGTTFTVYLPRLQEPAPGPTPAPAAPARAGDTVLVAEDHPGVRSLVDAILRRGGYTILMAQDGAEALELGRQHAGEIRLLIADLALPQMSGPQVAEAVRALVPGLKVLFMSGDASAGEDQAQPLPPGSDFLPKPFAPEVLLAKVRAILGATNGV